MSTYQRSRVLVPEDLRRYGQRSYDPRLRALVPLFKGHVLRQRGVDCSALGRDDEGVSLVLRAAKNPMNIGSGGTAAQLAATRVIDDVVPLSGPSAAIELGRLGMQVEFGRYASVAVPGRVCDPNDCGSFVVESDPIPVKVMSLSTTTLTPARLAVIAVFSDWLAESSNADRVIPQIMNEVGLLKYDAELLSATAASASRPAGLLNGVVALTATTAGSEAMEKDIAQLVAAIENNGGGANVVFIANPAQAATLKFKAGPKFNYPILASAALASGTVVAIEVGSYVSAVDPIPEYDVSRATAVHMEDTSPAQLASGTGPTVATPIRSMYQTLTTAVKMVLTVSWGMRASGHVQLINSVNW
jgi:hypothetical protein